MGSIVNDSVSRKVVSDKINNDFSKEIGQLDKKYNGMMKTLNELDEVQERIFEKSSNEAYEKTIEYLNKVDPDYMKEIIRLNNGSTKNLDDYHDFRKTFEGIHDHILQRYEESTPDGELYSRKIQEFESASKDYNKSVKELSSQMIGRYGNKKVNGYKLSEEMDGVIRSISSRKYYNRSD